MYLSPKPSGRKSTAWLRGKKSWDAYRASKESNPAPSKKAVFAAAAKASLAIESDPAEKPKKSRFMEFLRKAGIRF